ncbi:hypothetical protein BSLG_000801 [Batrachochytrium salamandrivorans]|nr:hypothetical protein BSLG_000801 [Batrachochytrium salamandrivorans]
MSATVIYSNAIKLKTELQHDVASLESNQGSPLLLQSKIKAGLVTLQRSIKDLEDLSRREVTAIKRETTTGRAVKLRDECSQIQGALDRFRNIEATRQQRSNASGTEEQSTILMMDGLLNERAVLDGADQGLEQYLSMGRSALQELYEQRSMLKSTQKRLLDVANSLGLSTSVIRFIEQRTASDKWILYGGLSGTVLILWGIVHYLG